VYIKLWLPYLRGKAWVHWRYLNTNQAVFHTDSPYLFLLFLAELTSNLALQVERIREKIKD